MEESKILKSYELVDKNELVISQLPEKIRNKFEMLDELLDNYEEATTEDEEFEIKEKILACDTGLSSDLEAHIANNPKEDEDDADKAQNKMKEGGTTEEENPISNEKPTWRFWM